MSFYFELINNINKNPSHLNIKNTYFVPMILLGCLSFLNIIYCTTYKTKKRLYSSRKDSNLLEKLNIRKKGFFRDNKVLFRNKKSNDKTSGTDNPLAEPFAKCQENSEINLFRYKLDKLNYSKIFYLAYSFYEKLLKHPEFLRTCAKIGFNIEQDIPPKEMFIEFVLKFIFRKNFPYNITKVNLFIQSIARLVHRLIVQWSQSHLSTYMLTEWSDVWSKIFNSIRIKTDKDCHWEITKLFDKEKLDEVSNQIIILEIVEYNYPKFLKNFKEINPSLFNNNVPVTSLSNLSISE